MFGTILKLDCKRQNRVNPQGFLTLFKQDNHAKIMALDTKAPKLNSSFSGFPGTSVPVKNTIYPEFLGATTLRTLYHRLAMFGDVPKMTQVFINKDDSLVFEFAETVTKETADRVAELINHMGYTNLSNPEYSGKRLGFDIELKYVAARGEADE